MGKLSHAAAAIGLAALAAGTAHANDKITLGTNWVAQTRHGGYYQALADGIHASYGLDVTIKPGGPQVNTAQMLLGGALDIALFANDFMSDARWQDFFDTMVKAGVYKPETDFKAAYTLQFVNKKVEGP